MPDLKGCKVAVLTTDGFEQVELTEPRKALEDAGAQTTVVAPKSGEIRGWEFTEWGDQVKVDEPLDSASPDCFDALLLPGGVMNPDKLRMKPEAGVARGRKIASWPSIKTDLRNAGAEWMDKEAVTDGNLVSARKPDDIPAFNRAMVELFSKGMQKAHRASP